MIHLRLLSTPPHSDAVTFSYRPESACLEGTCTPLIEYTFRRTRSGFARRNANHVANVEQATLAFCAERLAQVDMPSQKLVVLAPMR